ncbi:prolyl oligopeptidase family serine peptidase [Terrimonas sp. NA20]|uniref:Prolyl oligopeptidase family serine peptidase n=1 Tax=Terrimonas ginsenosidimutans TaxID=2908004 RepID=A0ABS9KXS0_9BACT|nr:prolyl oligopeptidase family serine peptidase [Terrimonas ginsenosidimutans]MCG2617042.1 prolyl oligopeptidase family serine peptidase [Terrimonas ginsenosidimutans]
MWFRLTAIFLFCLMSSGAVGQVHTYDNAEVDSLTFQQTRKVLIDLSPAKYLKKTYKSGDVELPYRLLLPDDIKSGQKYPLVVTLHNSSRIGTDNENQLEPLARIWLRTEISSKYKCFVLAPHFSKRSSDYTPNGQGVLVSNPSADVPVLLKLIDSLEKEYPGIDKSRIYLVGYSMGGSTAQNLLNIAPAKFAAMVSIAGVPDMSNTGRISSKPIWLIHGKKDQENPYAGSQLLYRKLSGNKNLVFTTFSNLDHNSINIPFLLSEKIPQYLFAKYNR